MCCCCSCDEGDRQFLPDTKIDSTYAVANGLKFGGFLIAHTLVGCLVVSIMFILFFLFVTFTIVLPLPVKGFLIIIKKKKEKKRERTGG